MTIYPSVTSVMVGYALTFKFHDTAADELGMCIVDFQVSMEGRAIYGYEDLPAAVKKEIYEESCALAVEHLGVNAKDLVHEVVGGCQVSFSVRDLHITR